MTLNNYHPLVNARVVNQYEYRKLDCLFFKTFEKQEFYFVFLDNQSITWGLMRKDPHV